MYDAGLGGSAPPAQIALGRNDGFRHAHPRLTPVRVSSRALPFYATTTSNTTPAGQVLSASTRKASE